MADAVELTKHRGPAPERASIERHLGAEAQRAHSWSNGPGDRYGEHDHPYEKILYCLDGSIDFILGDGRRLSLAPGDRLVIPPGTRHSAVVGPDGCTCVEGQAR